MRNRAKCGNCGDIIESKHRHDWVACSCFVNEIDNPGIFIDGGTSYFRAGFSDPNKFIRLFDDGTEKTLVEIEEEAQNQE